MRPGRLFGRVAALVVALVIVAGAVWLWRERVDPATISQQQLHEIGTTSTGRMMAPVPSQHRVVVRGVYPEDLTRAARAYFPRWLGGLADSEVQGYYDPATDEIHLTGELTRLQAMAPLPWLQGRFRHALRHEYGHAMLDEWLEAKAAPDQVATVPQITQRGPVGMDEVPPRLQPLVREYRRLDDQLYGASYYTSYFTEFFAESYARYLDGGSVPPEMQRFLEENSRPR